MSSVAGLDLETELELDIDTDSGEHDVFAHYAEKEEVTEAMIMGWPVVALCGKIWVPFRDPSRYPICPTCQEIYKQMMNL